MAVLEFKKEDNNIKIIHKLKPYGNETKERTLTKEELKELTTKYLAYYKEGATDKTPEITLPKICTTMEEYNSGNPPMEFTEQDAEYWHCRKEIYNYIKENKLFEITEIKNEIPEWDKKVLKREAKINSIETCKEILKKYITIYEQVKTYKEIEISENQVQEFNNKYTEACKYTTENICKKLENKLIKDYNTFEKEEKCSICPIEVLHKEKDGIYRIIMKVRKLMRNKTALDLYNEKKIEKIKDLSKKIGKKTKKINNIKTLWGING